MEVLLRQFIIEAIVTGRKLDRYATLLTRHVIDALKDEDIQNAFAEQEKLKFKLQDVVELGDISYLEDVFIHLHDADTIQATGAYEYDVGGTPEQRETSDIHVHIHLPIGYPKQIFNDLGNELIDAFRHELEHSGQPTEELDIVQKKVPDSEIWKTLKRAEDYYRSDSEKKAHIPGWVKRAKRQRRPANEVIDEELYSVYATGLNFGYEKDELAALMKRISEDYYSYFQQRYPKAF